MLRPPFDRRTGLALAFCTSAFMAPAHAFQATTRESVDSSNQQATGGASGSISMTPDGRYIVFSSQATNVVPNDTNGAGDVFRRDRQTGTTIRVSVDAGGAQVATYASGGATISDDGRYVAFTTNGVLLPADTNNSVDVYVKDIQTGAVVRANLSSAGAQGAQFCENARLSGNGRYVAFASFDTGFVPNDLNGVEDVFLRDLQTNTTTLVSVSTVGAQAGAACNNPSISADGRYVAFTSSATNLVPNDNNGLLDAFVRDTVLNTTVRVNVDSAGVEANGASGSPILSADGRFAAWTSGATNHVMGDANGQLDVFLRDLTIGRTTLVSTSSSGAQGNLGSVSVALSPDGRFVAFGSLADNFVAGDTNSNFDAFLKDRLTDQTTRVSVSTAGVGGNFGSFPDAVSANGRYVLMDSECTNLVANDTNGQYDVFLRDRGAPTPIAYCTAKVSGYGCSPAIGWSGTPSASAGSGFNVTASSIKNASNGALFYGYDFDFLSFMGGTLCMRGTLVRTPIVNSGGSPATVADCTGAFSFDFNAWILTGADPTLTAGRSVFCQFYYRDPPTLGGMGLTNALQFFVGP